MDITKDSRTDSKMTVLTPLAEDNQSPLVQYALELIEQYQFDNAHEYSISCCKKGVSNEN